MDRADVPSPGTYDVPAWVERFEITTLRGFLDNRSAKKIKADGVADVQVWGRARCRCELDWFLYRGCTRLGIIRCLVSFLSIVGVYI